MGPFGIAAVGLLANKSKHKQSHPRDSKGGSAGLDALSKLDGGDPIRDADHGPPENFESGYYPRDDAKLPTRTDSLSPRKQKVSLKALPGDSVAVSKDERSRDKRSTSMDTGNLLSTELNNIKTRPPSESLRTVFGASDSSHSHAAEGSNGCGSPSVGRRQGSSFKELKQVVSRDEHSSIKLRRSGKIKAGIPDSLLVRVHNLSIEGAMQGAPFIQENACAGTRAIENLGPFTGDQSVTPRNHQPSEYSCDTAHGSEAGSGFDLQSSHSGTSTEPFAQPETTELYDSKETESPRFKALLRLTKKTSVSITSFSHELSSAAAPTSNPFWRIQNAKNSEAVVDALQARFYSAKEQVNSELAVFAADLLDFMEAEKQDKDSQAKQEDLLVLAKDCSFMSVEDFREQCEGIVQKLEEERQNLPVGRLKQLHTRLLFILTRCTRLLQYQKESGTPKQQAARYRSGLIGSKGTLAASKERLAKRYYSQEQRVTDWMKDNLVVTQSVTEALNHSQTIPENETGFKKPPKDLKSGAHGKFDAESSTSDAASLSKASLSPKLKDKSTGGKQRRKAAPHRVQAASKDLAHVSGVPPRQEGELHRIKVPRRDLEDIRSVICRICEDQVPTVRLEEHSRICALALQCDVKGLSVDDRLCKLAEILDKMLHAHTPSSAQPVVQGNSPDKFQSCAFNKAVSQSDLRQASDAYQKGDGSPDNQEMEHATEVISFKSLFGNKSEHSRASSSAGSITPKSPLPNPSYFDVQLEEQASLGELENPEQVGELADIARCIASTSASETGAIEYLVSCSQDLQTLFQQCKDEALTVHTFGKRIEKLLRRKYMVLRESSNETEAPRHAENVDVSVGGKENFKSMPSYGGKDRTSIDDFEIIKPISRGAYGRVFLARKRTTGDLFAIKVLRKADMIRKNAVESILAERDILISARNPFVVRFFYSFTCSENLYLVMEYLIGGDLYSLLRNIGCLDERISQIYIAEVVLALEYLHSLGVVHRDLKPDNLLIAHDGHMKLTDFGLSKVGLINSTDDLSGSCSSGILLASGDLHTNSGQSHLRAKRQKHSAVGTPDYLAPEILLGTGHGSSADWWSTGIILFECLTGVPPFNADHPQRIFENILNRKIPWPRVPEDMSADAKDLIDKLLTEDPALRLGANGAAEVKSHPYFKDINWDTLARQKAAFVPNPESPHDTSYFTSRHQWSASGGFENATGEIAHTEYNVNDEERREKVDEQFDQPGDLIDFSGASPSRFSFSNFSFKNLSQLASINYDLLMRTTGKDEPKR